MTLHSLPEIASLSTSMALGHCRTPSHNPGKREPGDRPTTKVLVTFWIDLRLTSVAGDEARHRPWLKCRFNVGVFVRILFCQISTVIFGLQPALTSSRLIRNEEDT